ncbi:MAG: DNA helicase II, partial [Gammaproteobacteria bacterium]|nr:DNA helicase II [Gammaproteobacteria bacterium]
MITSVLNSEQQSAVTAPVGNLLVLAGAGSGKTRVLVERIVWLLQNEQISPANVLAVTFTNKAAREMRGRLEKLLQIPLETMWVGTFHGLAHRLLRLHWQEAGLPQTFQILDSEDQFRLIKQIQKSLDIDQEKWPVKQTQWFINQKKDEGLRSSHLQQRDDLFAETMGRIYTAYEERCNNSGLVDFAELLLRSHELWLNNQELLQHYRSRFQHILVDEFQDTNSIQYAWIKNLAGKSSYLTAVGDDDQSIYGWRGAKIENIHRFSKDFAATKIIRLEQNYRSTNNILTAANAVIANNDNRLGKRLWTDSAEGELITLYAAFNEIDEARFIANQIRQQQDNDNIAYHDIAILYRSNAQSRVLEEQLIDAGIPYRIYGGRKFFERAEIKDALAYLRLIANRDDDAAFMRIVNVPTRGVGNVTLAALRDYANENKLSLWSAVAQIKLTSRASNALQSFCELIDSATAAVQNFPLDEQIEHLLYCTGLREYFARDKSATGRMRLENLDELVSACRQFAVDADDSKSTAILQAFLAHAALEAGDAEATDADDGVQLMTLHSAKGLEFPIVFLGGMESGLFPHYASLEDSHKLEEERRLCYVGMTRAMRKLYLTYACSRRLHGSETYRQPSKFLREIPHELIDEFQLFSNVSRPLLDTEY